VDGYVTAMLDARLLNFERRLSFIVKGVGVFLGVDGRGDQQK
jgi:hypothetical protein